MSLFALLLIHLFFLIEESEAHAYPTTLQSQGEEFLAERDKRETSGNCFGVW